MKYLHNKKTFIVEKEFQLIMDELFSILESDDEQPLTFEWTIKNKSKLEKFLSKLNKRQVVEYFEKFIKWLDKLPGSMKSKILIPTISIFLVFASSQELTSSNIPSEIKSSILSIGENDVDRPIKDIPKIPKANFGKAQEMVKKGEGGYTDDKDDSGNWVDGKLVGTNFGISAPQLKDHLGKTPSKKDMENLSYDSALKIYKKEFWSRNNLEFLNNQYVANIIYDGVVNQGRGGTKKVLQNVLKEFDMDIKLKDIFEPETIKKMNNLDQEELFNNIFKFRWERYKGTKKFDKYGKGWKNRLDEFKFNKT